MSKTIIETMSSIREKMRDKGGDMPMVNMGKAAEDIQSLAERLQMTQVQAVLMTAIMAKSSRWSIDADDIASLLDLEYLQFLTYDTELEGLRKRGYVRMDNEGHLRIPKKVLKSLKNNVPVEPEPTIGLTTSGLLCRIKEYLEFLGDEEMSFGEFLCEVEHLLELNPETSLSKSCKKYLKNVDEDERVVLYALIYRFWFEKDDMVGWHDLEQYFDETDFAELQSAYSREAMDLQKNGVIEYSREIGIMDKDYFKIKDDIMQEIFEDVGGIRKHTVKVSASREMKSDAIVAKELFYNPDEERQMAQLKDLMSEARFNEIRGKIHDRGMRTGFTCLFYGAPGTGKTETVYQIARSCGRDLYIVDVSQIKSCWVGESEKNIKNVFAKYRQCVATGGTVPILLFNEADAIFGIRQEGAERAVDKMENSIQNIILQEMEDLDGILIATTNLTTNLDKAFERRFLYKVRFEKPSKVISAAIWRSMMPELTMAQAEELAGQYSFSGGQIENVARKKTIKAILAETEPDYEQIKEFCSEETIDNAPARKKIGF
ncbi:MAG: ATP-binding protein [Bacteroidales bacterium]|nr:ATP-binding protein [Bacteroidales bacterium]